MNFTCTRRQLAALNIKVIGQHTCIMFAFKFVNVTSICTVDKNSVTILFHAKRFRFTTPVNSCTFFPGMGPKSWSCNAGYA